MMDNFAAIAVTGCNLLTDSSRPQGVVGVYALEIGLG